MHEAYQAEFPSFDLAYAVYWQKTQPDTALRSEEGGERSEAGPESESDHKDTKAQCQHEERGTLEPGSLLSQLLDESGRLPLIGLVPKISKLVSASLDPSIPRPLDPSLSTWWTERGERELEDLPQMEPAAIVECLPKLWASDLKDFLGASSFKPQAPSKGKAVLFVDSYEKLWGMGDEGRRTKDEGRGTEDRCMGAGTGEAIA